MRDGMELRPDFAEMLPRIKQGALQREMLVKAARVKGVEAPRAVDATAGLGEDSLLPDFAEMLPRIKQGALQREMLVKAARVKGVEAPRAVDATAGLGEDSLLLAAQTGRPAARDARQGRPGEGR